MEKAVQGELNEDGSENSDKNLTDVLPLLKKTEEINMNKYERNVKKKKRGKAARLVFYWVGSGERGINNKRVGAVLQSGSQTRYTTLLTRTLTTHPTPLPSLIHYFLNQLLLTQI